MMIPNRIRQWIKTGRESLRTVGRSLSPRGRSRSLLLEPLEHRMLLAIAAGTPDRFEPNDTQQTATILGSVPKITLNDLTIAPTIRDPSRLDRQRHAGP